MMLSRTHVTLGGVAAALALALSVGLTGARSADAAPLASTAASAGIQLLPLAPGGGAAGGAPLPPAREGQARYREMASHVDGYYRRDGTYVSPHYRSDPNDTVRDNWSYAGNYNPYTGSRGTKSYDPSYPSYSGYGGYASRR